MTTGSDLRRLMSACALIALAPTVALAGAVEPVIEAEFNRSTGPARAA